MNVKKQIFIRSVYRIEDSNGIGPYHSAGKCGIDFQQELEHDLWGRHPVECFPTERYIDKSADKYFYGFHTWPAACAWFGAWGPMGISLLDRAGYKMYCYMVEHWNVHVFPSGKQCAFLRDVVFEKYEIPLRLLLDASLAP